MTLPLTEARSVPEALLDAAEARAVGRPAGGSRRGKRAFDVVVALTALVVLAPLLLAVALLVSCTSRGPVLYAQRRVGRGGRVFTMVKFRTMRVGADRQRAALIGLNEASGPLFKIRRDPRLTGVGRWLRRSSLDELPQLLNVLAGSMALVGPRPALPEEVASFDATARRRHAVRPGLTGLSQVSGRSDLSWEQAIALDLHYVDHRSPGLDLRILARTVAAVLRGRGAY